MTTYTIDLPDAMQECLISKSRENFRELSQEILYRLNQALKMDRHISENEIGLFKILSEIRDKHTEEENENRDIFRMHPEFSEILN